jgi:hypothetical protein
MMGLGCDGANITLNIGILNGNSNNYLFQNSD